MEIGILAIQGSVAEHEKSLKKCGLNPRLVRTTEDLNGLTGLIIPGGESTTISKLLNRFGLHQAIKQKVAAGMGIYGTCAGAIIAAREIVEENRVLPLEAIDVKITRNAYGRQLDSFETLISAPKISPKKIPATFIRAPQIISAGKNVEILAEYHGRIILAREGSVLISTFHPELTGDLSVHKYFINICPKSNPTLKKSSA